MSLTTDPEAPHGRDEDGTPKAPYGLKADGQPKKLPGRPNTAFPKAPPAKKPGAAKKGAVNYIPGLLGLGQIPAMGLAVAGMRSPACAADAAVVAVHLPALAAALNEVAQEQPALAAVLDRVLQVGPYGLVLAAALPMFMQIGTNHGLIPAGMGGTVKKEVILAQLAAEQREDEAEQAVKAAA